MKVVLGQIMYVEYHTKRQIYKNAKAHNVYHHCVLFLIKLRWAKNKSLYEIGKPSSKQSGTRTPISCAMRDFLLEMTTHEKTLTLINKHWRDPRDLNYSERCNTRKKVYVGIL